MAAIYFIKKVPSPFLLLGTISYSLYLTHGGLVGKFMALAERYLHSVNIWLLAILCTIFCMVFAWIYYVTIEKLFINLSKKIKYQHSAAS